MGAPSFDFLNDKGEFAQSCHFRCGVAPPRQARRLTAFVEEKSFSELRIWLN